MGRGAARQGQYPRQLGSSRHHATDAHIRSTADPAIRAERMRFIPMRSAGEVDEVAYTILFLASDESSYITGSEIHVDGGVLAI
ncbi:MAG TPA: SDR family oxidoreductase [Terracidiphilus sp.]|nr:SDR family oxidoreductase [Terracidiphilus sp.]